METVTIILSATLCFVCVFVSIFAVVWVVKNPRAKAGVRRAENTIGADISPDERINDDMRAGEEAYACVPNNIAQATAQTTPQEAEEDYGAEQDLPPQQADREEVSFSASTSKTLDEKFGELSKQQKAFYEEVAAYAAGKEYVRRFKNNRFESYKIGYNVVVKMLIRRGEVVCEFVALNSGADGVKGGSSLNLATAEDVQTAKSCIDAAYVAICGERLKKSEDRRNKGYK